MKKRIWLKLVVIAIVCTIALLRFHYSKINAQTSDGDWGCWITDGGKCSWDTHDWGGSDYTPLMGDVNGDGKEDRVLYRASDGDWGCWITDGGKCNWDAQDWGGGDYTPLVGDVNGDGKKDRILYRASDGDWRCWITDGGKCSWDTHDWGGSDYTPLMGDVNGDGKEDRVLYRASNGDWGCWITDGGKCSWDRHDWGNASYVALVGDVNGDGKEDRVLYRASDGDWGCWITDGGKCSWDRHDWGSSDYTPLVGDVNGDGKEDRVLYRASDGDWGCWITDGGKCNWDAQDWGDASYVALTGDVNGDGKEDRIVHQVSINSRIINLTISLYTTATTDAQKAPYVGIIENFADAIYEMSNGTHRIGRVSIFQNGENINAADVVWADSVWPNVPGGCISGVGRRECRVNMADTFSFGNPYVATQSANWRGAGYTLAHEWGHYYYGIYDEYPGDAQCDDPNAFFRPQKCDSMLHSVMNSQWKATGGNYDWLNFGIAANQTNHNVTWRVYGASAWEVLARSPNQDPRNGHRRKVARLTFYPELARVAPPRNSASPIELPTSNARSALQIDWIDPTLTNATSRIMAASAYNPTLRLANGHSIWYPEAAVLIASLSKDGGFVAKSGITGTATAPDNTTMTLFFNDDGVPPDYKANDGLYSASWLYNQNGEHNVTVQFNNASRTAEVTYISNHYTPGPGGEEYQPSSIPISEDFNEQVSLDIHVNSYPPNVGSPQSPTQLTTDNRNFPGRIDTAGDKDFFTFTTTQSGEIVARLTDLDFEMYPHIKIFKGSTSPSLIGDYEFIPSGNTYFFTKLTADAQDTFSIEVSHSNPNATEGLFNISVGTALLNEMDEQKVFLPIIIK